MAGTANALRGLLDLSMQPEHRIDELIVDLSFTTTRLARHEQALLSDWLSEDLLPALDQLFSRYSPGQQVLRFETLEFDFGNLTNRNYQHRIREQLLQKMAQLLQTQLLAVGPTHLRLPEHATSGDNPNARMALTQLFSYLASGQLSAHQPIVKQAALHEQLLDAVIAQHNIAELLRELPQRDALIQRLLTQFSVPQRLELLRQLAPQHIQDTSALLDLLQLFESNPLNADGYRVDSKLVWQVLLQLGLEYPTANTEFWLSRILRAVSANRAVDVSLLQQQLVAIRIPSSSAASPLINLQTQIAQLSASENASIHSGLTQSDRELQNPEQLNTEQLRQQIASAFIRADVSQLEQLWPQLVTNQSQLLLAAIEHYLRQAEIRQQLVLHLPLVLQVDVIALLAPALKDVFLQLQIKAGQLIELLQLQTTVAPEIKSTGVTNKTEGLTGQSPELLLRQLWEIALGLIFNNQSAAVNADSVGDRDGFVMSLAARYADLHNLDHNFVQQAFVSLFNQPQTHQQSPINTVNLPKQSGTLHGNATVAHEQQTIKPEVDLLFDSAASVSAESGSTSQKNIGLEKNDQTSKNLAVKNQEANSDQADNQGSDSHEATNVGIKSLSSISDHQLFDLCLRLKSGALAWSSLANDVTLLQRLISSYIRLGHSATAENCTDFVAAIAAQAESSHAPSAFYLAVLQTLIADKLIDLEAIAQGIQRSDKSYSLVSKTKIETREEIAMIEDTAVQASALRNVEVSTANTDPVESVAKQLQLDALAVQLQQGNINPESLSLTVDQITQLVDIFITTEKTIAPDIQADLIAAIHQQALRANHKADYYQRILSMLVRKEMLDLMQVCEQVNQRAIAQPTTPAITVSNNIEAIVRTLLAESAPERRLQALQLDLAQWQSLVAELIQTLQSIDTDSSAELLEAIQRQARQVTHSAHYYRLVIAAVLAREPIDLDAFTRAANSSTELMPAQLPARPQNISQRVSSLINSTTSARVIAQTLLTDPQSWALLQQLQLDDKQWETLSAELIRQAQFIDQHASAELIEAIQTQARLAITPVAYYRLVIQAVLQQEPIDLEAFAATTDNLINQQDHQVATGEFVVKQSNSGKSTPPVLDTDPIDAVPVLLANISQNTIDSQQVNPDQAMDYPLLTGSDNSLRKPALSLAQLLAAELPLNQEQLLALQQHINALLNRSNAAMMNEWSELLASAQHAQVLIYSVPAHLLHQIAMRLHAGRYPWLDAIIKLVMEALALLVADINNLPIKQAKWKFIFNYLFAPGNTTSSGTETSARALELSIALCEQLANAAGIDDVQRLVNLTQRRIALLKPPAQQKPAVRLQDITSNPATHSDATTPQWEAGLHINNAGQVLAAAFLPRLFSMLNLLQDGKFIDLGAADRAVHLVQFMVTGQSTTPEYELVLNKILCGISTSIPVSAGIEITEQEQTLIEQMLNSMIQHWKVLGSTSITGLRETFFQRQGWLVLEEDCWRLKVKEQTFDLLLDRLPWSISLIKHGWMDKPLRVSWRNHS